MGWAKTYLDRAGLLKTTRRGVVEITAEGKRVLDTAPDRIDMRFLEQFASYREFRENGATKATATKQASSLCDVQTPRTPDEQIEEAAASMRESLAMELLSLVTNSTDPFFERLVVELIVAMGYGGSIEDAGKAVGRSGDGGIDGIIKQDKLGLDVVVIQAKRWKKNSVGRPEVQAFAGSMEGFRASKGVFITTSTFSPQAREYVEQIQRKIVLVDGQKMADLMIEHDVAVHTYRTIALKRVDADDFEE